MRNNTKKLFAVVACQADNSGGNSALEKQMQQTEQTQAKDIEAELTLASTRYQALDHMAKQLRLNIRQLSETTTEAALSRLFIFVCTSSGA